MDNQDLKLRVKQLEEALGDACSVFGNKPDFIVTEERVETWKQILESGHKELEQE